MKHIVIGGELDGRMMSRLKHKKNPIWEHPDIYLLREFTIVQKDPNKFERIRYFTPERFSTGDVIRALIKRYKEAGPRKKV